MIDILPIEPSAEADWLLGKISYNRKEDVRRFSIENRKENEDERDDRSTRTQEEGN